MTDRPPLVPADVDLRDFPFMPVDITRLFGSNFHASTNDSEWRAGVTLWMKSYHQVPAASLPDDDIALTMLADLGRDQKTWKRIKAKALQGWTKCSDGRLYHKVVAEKALEAWIEKLAQRKVSTAGNAKRWGSEADTSDIEAALETAVELLKALNPNSRQLLKRIRKGPPSQSKTIPVGNDTGSLQDANGIPVVIPSGSQETGTGTGNIEEPSPDRQQHTTAVAPVAAAPVDIHDLARVCQEAAGLTNERMVPSLEVIGPIADLIDKQWSLERHIMPVLRSLHAKGKYFRSWKIYADEVVQKNAPLNSTPAPPDQPPPVKQTEENLMLMAKTFIRRGHWPFGLVPEPGMAGTPITPEILERARTEIAAERQKQIALHDESDA